MECDRCHAKIESGEEKQHVGQTLCEDCYMDALSPVKTCDPWAVHSAKSFEKYSESTPTLTPIQSEILSILEKTGGIEPNALLEKLNAKLTQKELEREFAALRHMEKARGEKRGDRILWRRISKGLEHWEPFAPTPEHWQTLLEKTKARYVRRQAPYKDLQLVERRAAENPPPADPAP